jgi:hypothetical protein
MRCENCGKDVEEGLGDWVDRGFVCKVCQDALDYLLCIKCGRRFRRDDMIEWDGKFYCRGCVKVRKPIVRLKPITKLKGGAIIPRKPSPTAPRKKGIKDIEPSLIDVHRAVRRNEEKEAAGEFGELEKEISKDTEELDKKDEVKDSLEELKQLREKLDDARVRKKRKDDEDYSLKGE